MSDENFELQWLEKIKTRTLEAVRSHGTTPAWKALGEALVGNKCTGSECLDIFIKARSMETGLTGREVEKVLVLINDHLHSSRSWYTSVSLDNRHDLMRDPRKPPTWMFHDYVFLDGPEVQNLWGDLRSYCSSPGPKQLYNIQGVLKIVLMYKRQAGNTYDVSEAFTELYVQMRDYARASLGGDIDAIS
jgi:hypothetical protein